MWLRFFGIDVLMSWGGAAALGCRLEEMSRKGDKPCKKGRFTTTCMSDRMRNFVLERAVCMRRQCSLRGMK
jgi:hypothetical protein